MKRSRFRTAVSMCAGLFTGLLFATFAFSLDSQVQPGSRAEVSFARAYDAAHEIKISGNVEDVVTRHVAGSPVGLHLLIAAPQGTVDAHLGPYLDKDTQEALHAGTPVQIVGAMQTFHGKQVLLARQLIFGGRLITVRSTHGFLVRGQGHHVVSSSTESKGGSR